VWHTFKDFYFPSIALACFLRTAANCGRTGTARPLKGWDKARLVGLPWRDGNPEFATPMDTIFSVSWIVYNYAAPP